MSSKREKFNFGQNAKIGIILKRLPRWTLFRKVQKSLREEVA